MKELNIENFTISLTIEGDNVRAKSDKESVLLANQSIDNIAELIFHNFKVVKNHYKLLASKAEKLFELRDVYYLSLSIVLHYLYLYNSWRVMYRKQENKDLKFDEKDFDNASTHDIIFYYFKSRYPEDWEVKCATLLDLNLEELKAYYKKREAFYNK